MLLERSPVLLEPVPLLLELAAAAPVELLERSKTVSLDSSKTPLPGRSAPAFGVETYSETDVVEVSTVSAESEKDDREAVLECDALDEMDTGS